MTGKILYLFRSTGYNRGNTYNELSVISRQAESKYNLIIIPSVATTYCANCFWLKKAAKFPIISYILKCHFNDWLAGIGIVAYINLLLILWQTGKIRIKSISSASFICLVCGLLWEYALPLLFRRGTSDFGDIVHPRRYFIRTHIPYTQ